MNDQEYQHYQAIIGQIELIKAKIKDITDGIDHVYDRYKELGEEHPDLNIKYPEIFNDEDIDVSMINLDGWKKELETMYQFIENNKQALNKLMNKT